METEPQPLASNLSGAQTPLDKYKDLKSKDKIGMLLSYLDSLPDKTYQSLFVDILDEMTELSSNSITKPSSASLDPSEPHQGTNGTPAVSALSSSSIEVKPSNIENKITIHDVKDALAVIPKVTMIGNVRGTFDIAILKDRIIILPSGKEIVASNIFVIPQLPKDSSQYQFSRILFVSFEAVDDNTVKMENILMNFKETIKSIDVELIQDPAKGNDLFSLSAEFGQQSKKLSGNPSILFEKILMATQTKSAFKNLAIDKVYTSASGSLGFTCYSTVNDGQLYPNELGFIFLQRPCTFIPFSLVQETNIARSGSRTFELILTLKKQIVTSQAPKGVKKITFSMIDNTEHQLLSTFCKNGIAKQQQIQNQSSAGKQSEVKQDANAEEEEDDDDDSEFDGLSSSDDDAKSNTQQDDDETEDEDEAKEKEMDVSDNSEASDDEDGGSGSEEEEDDESLADIEDEDFGWAEKEADKSNMDYRKLRGNKRIKLEN